MAFCIIQLITKEACCWGDTTVAKANPVKLKDREGTVICNLVSASRSRQPSMIESLVGNQPVVFIEI
jgi:hypothetical protein